MSTDPKLTVDGWKAVAQKSKLKDKDLQKDLQKALLHHEGLDEDDYDSRSKSGAKLVSLAAALKRDEEVASLAPVVKYLTDLIGAAQTEQRDAARGKAEAEKSADLAAKSEAEAKKGEQALEDGDDEDGEEDAGGPEEYSKKLQQALDNLKTAKKPYRFIFCDGKPVGALAISKGRVGPKHLKVLMVVTGGGKHFTKPGTVTREGGTLVFELVKPQPGLAVKILKSIKFFTDRKFKIKVGTESAEDDAGTTESGVADTTQAADAPDVTAQGARPEAAKPSLEKAPEVWSVTQRVVKSRIDQLKASVRESFAAEGPDLLAEIERNMKKLDAVFEKLDDELADLLRKAHAASDAASRNAELKAAKALLAEHIKYVKSEPMIAHIDSNPFGVVTNLQPTLMKSLKHVVQAIGEER